MIVPLSIQVQTLLYTNTVTMIFGTSRFTMYFFWKEVLITEVTCIPF